MVPFELAESPEKSQEVFAPVLSTSTDVVCEAFEYSIELPALGIWSFVMVICPKLVKEQSTRDSAEKRKIVELIVWVYVYEVNR